MAFMAHHILEFFPRPPPPRRGKGSGNSWVCWLSTSRNLEDQISRVTDGGGGGPMIALSCDNALHAQWSHVVKNWLKVCQTFPWRVESGNETRVIPVKLLEIKAHKVAKTFTCVLIYLCCVCVCVCVCALSERVCSCTDEVARELSNMLQAKLCVRKFARSSPLYRSCK